MQIKFNTCGPKSAFKDAIGYGMLNVPIPQDRGEDPFLPSSHGNVTAIHLCLLGQIDQLSYVVILVSSGNGRNTSLPGNQSSSEHHPNSVCHADEAIAWNCSLQPTVFSILAVQRSSVLKLTFSQCSSKKPGGVIYGSSFVSDVNQRSSGTGANRCAPSIPNSFLLTIGMHLVVLR